MRYLRDTGVLILYSFLALFFIEADMLFVLAFLGAVIVCCANSFLESRCQVLMVTGGYLIIAMLCTAFIVFVPVVAYVWFRQRAYPLIVAVGALLLYQAFGAGQVATPLIFLLLLGILLAWIFARETEGYERLEVEFKHSRDDSVERNLLLAEKNRVLLENQDYEIFTATLQERNRIAREIHDNVGHMLSRSILMVGALRAVSKEDAVKESLNALSDTLNSAMDSIRNSVHDLHDEAINLEEAIRGLVTDFQFCQKTLEYDMGREVPKEVKYCFISITKEGLSNVIRHSNATKVHIIMREHPALYQLCIEDNGRGGKRGSDGIGLVNMQDRINTLRGNIQFSSENGFRIFITIPKENKR